jgi:ureidoglycolate hydrolase
MMVAGQDAHSLLFDFVLTLSVRVQFEREYPEGKLMIRPLYQEPVDTEVFVPLDLYGPFVSIAPNVSTPCVTFVPAPGDWVKTYLPRLGVWHHGIVTAWNVFETAVVHNSKGRGVAQTNRNTFSEGNPILLVQRALSEEHVQQILERANASMGRPYYLFNQNCEHFAFFAFNGKAESPTVMTFGVLALAGFGIWALFSN